MTGEQEAKISAHKQNLVAMNPTLTGEQVERRISTLQDSLQSSSQVAARKEIKKRKDPLFNLPDTDGNDRVDRINSVLSTASLMDSVLGVSQRANESLSR